MAKRRNRNPRSTASRPATSTTTRDPRYTWDWFSYPATGDPPRSPGLPGPPAEHRIELARDVRLGFMDNLYLNLMPSRARGHRRLGPDHQLPPFARP